MGNFNQAAKSLLTKQALTKVGEISTAKALHEAGWDLTSLFNRYSDLYDDSTDEPGVRRAILADMAKIHGLMTPEEQGKVAPIINLQVNGDNVRVAMMLNPSLKETLVAGATSMESQTSNA